MVNIFHKLFIIKRMNDIQYTDILSSHVFAVTVSLLLSINRAKPLSEAVYTVELLKSLRREGHEALTGIDFSGNPNVS